jgi:hypothetical protein
VVAMPAADNEEPDASKDIRLVAGGGHGGRRQSRQEFWVWPLPPPVRSRSSANGRGTESPRAGLRSRPLRSALRHRKPCRSGLRPGNNGGCRVGRAVIRAPDEAEKRAGDRGTLPLSETRASAHRQSGRPLRPWDRACSGRCVPPAPGGRTGRGFSNCLLRRSHLDRARRVRARRPLLGRHLAG